MQSCLTQRPTLSSIQPSCARVCGVGVCVPPTVNCCLPVPAQYAILLLLALDITAKYILNSIDLQSENPWENKTVYMAYVEVVLGASVEVVHFVLQRGVLSKQPVHACVCELVCGWSV